MSFFRQFVPLSIESKEKITEKAFTYVLSGQYSDGLHYQTIPLRYVKYLDLKASFDANATATIRVRICGCFPNGLGVECCPFGLGVCQLVCIVSVNFIKFVIFNVRVIFGFQLTLVLRDHIHNTPQVVLRNNPSQSIATKKACGINIL